MAWGLLAVVIGGMAWAQPSREIAARPLVFALDEPCVPVELAGFDIEQDGALLEGDRPRIVEGSRVRFCLYWRPVGVWPEDLEVRIRLDGSGPTREEVYAVKTEGWQVGGVYADVYELGVWRVYCSGDVTLEFAVPSLAGAPGQWGVLYRHPAHVVPKAAPSEVDDDRLRAVFGDDCVRLHARFRLGRNAGIRLAVPEAARRPVIGVGLVSSLSYKALFG
ncbi:MAG TPA: hypothetical protein ENN80_07560, partial [Candidatus Hydrogenedentes bacterium]|nr:hypothetical protein [Candidatus Hydrogenedentota bacterium]